MYSIENANGLPAARSDLLTYRILVWHQMRRLGPAGKRVDQPQVYTGIGELGCVEMIQ